jgi:hypothetical protein
MARAPLNPAPPVAETSRYQLSDVLGKWEVDVLCGTPPRPLLGGGQPPEPSLCSVMCNAAGCHTRRSPRFCCATPSSERLAKCFLYRYQTIAHVGSGECTGVGRDTGAHNRKTAEGIRELAYDRGKQIVDEIKVGDSDLGGRCPSRCQSHRSHPGSNVRYTSPCMCGSPPLAA